MATPRLERLLAAMVAALAATNTDLRLMGGQNGERNIRGRTGRGNFGR
jgi:hypothetical protein